MIKIIEMTSPYKMTKKYKDEQHKQRLQVRLYTIIYFPV